MRRLMLGAALALMSGSAVHAQVETGRQYRWIEPRYPDDAVRRGELLYRRTIACVVERSAGRTRNLLDTIPGTGNEDRIIWRFQSRLDWCYTGVVGGLSFSWDLLRGGIAEVYYHRAFPTGLPAITVIEATAAAWALPRSAAFTSPGRAQQEMLHSVARCVVVRQPANVSTLLASIPLSAGERAAMRALQPDLSACLTSGITFTASRQSLRGLLAEAALHFGEEANGGFVRIAQAPDGSD